MYLIYMKPASLSDLIFNHCASYTNETKCTTTDMNTLCSFRPFLCEPTTLPAHLPVTSVWYKTLTALEKNVAFERNPACNYASKQISGI